MGGWGFAAIVAVAISGGLLWWGQRAQGRRSHLLAVETLTTGTIKALSDAAAGAAGPGAFRQRVEVVGTTQPVASGPLTSELSKTECVWHRHKVTRRYHHLERDSKGNQTRSTREEVMAENTTKDPFLVRDVDGTIPVVPTRVVQGARKSLSEFREPTAHDGEATVSLGPFELNLGGGDNTIGYEYEEWLLPVGKKVFIQGDATDASGELAIVEPEGSPKLIISTKSESELLEAAAKETTILRVASAIAAVFAVVFVVIELLR